MARRSLLPLEIVKREEKRKGERCSSASLPRESEKEREGKRCSFCFLLPLALSPEASELDASKMLGRKQSLRGGEAVCLADYGPDEGNNESTDIEWINKVSGNVLYRTVLDEEKRATSGFLLLDITTLWLLLSALLLFI